MKNSLRFELKRRWDNLYVYFIVILIINILATIAVGTKNSFLEVVGGLSIFIMLFVVTPIGLFSQDIKSIDEDFYSDKKYFTWSIPANGFEYLGTKFIASTIQMIIGYVMVWVFLTLEVLLAESRFKASGTLINNGNLLGAFCEMFVVIFLIYFFILMTIYLAKTLRKGFRYNERPGRFLSVVIFFMICEIEGVILGLVRSISWNVKFSFKIPCELILESRNVLTNYVSVNIVYILTMILMIVGMFILTSKLIEKEIDV